MNLKKTSNLICYLRHQYGFTQEQLAKKLHVTKSSICYWEGGCELKPESAYKIAKFFNISVSELLDGKLKSQTFMDCFKLNFNLDSFKFDGEIDKSNVKKARLYFGKIKEIQDEFLSLLLDIGEGQINSLQNDEFKYMHKYFILDAKYYSYLLNTYKDLPDYFSLYSKDERNDAEIALIKTINSQFCNNQTELKWELSKLYNRTYPLKEKEVFDYDDQELLKDLLSILTQFEKDALLTGNLKIEKEVKNEFGSVLGIEKTYIQNLDMNISEIEENKRIKFLLNRGCNVLLQNSVNNLNKYLAIDESLLKYLTGNKKEIINNIDLTSNSYLMYGDDTYGFANSTSLWKRMSYSEYLNIIDKNKTMYLKSLVTNKRTNSLKYLEDLKRYYES